MFNIVRKTPPGSNLRERPSLELRGLTIPPIVRFITDPIDIFQYIKNGKGVKTMEGVILEGITIDVSIAAFLFLGAVVTGVFLAWMNEEEKAGKNLTWAGWPLPETEKPVIEVEERLRAAA
jgi:hypothetical protein